MKITFNLAFRERTGIGGLTVERAETLRSLLLLLSERFGEEFRKSVFDHEQLSSKVLILVNGRSAHNLQKLETKLEENDVIDFFPSLEGG
jgi:MoaD family protein